MPLNSAFSELFSDYIELPCPLTAWVQELEFNASRYLGHSFGRRGFAPSLHQLQVFRSLRCAAGSFIKNPSWQPDRSLQEHWVLLLIYAALLVIYFSTISCFFCVFFSSLVLVYDCMLRPLPASLPFLKSQMKMYIQGLSSAAKSFFSDYWGS